MPKSKEYISDSDDSSEEELKPTKKKQKKEKDEKEDKGDKGASHKKVKSDDVEETIWDLGNNRQVNVRNFKGKYYVDIREMYYDKEGDLKPGKKGICLTMQQWRKFMEVVPDVDKVAKSKC